MVLAKRERVILMVLLIGLGLLAADRLAVSPLMQARTQAQTRINSLSAQLARDTDLLNRRRRLAPRWKEMAGTGLKGDPAEAESQVFHAIRDWSEECGVGLSLLKPERLTEKSRLPQIVFQASGTGSMDALARLLYKIQTAAAPIKVTELQITSRREGADDLSFQLRISTVYVPTRKGGSTIATSGPTTAPTVQLPQENPGAPGPGARRPNPQPTTGGRP